MDRRHFCKMMALALGSVGFGAFKMNSAEMMPVSDGHVMPCACSVSVISMECHEDLQSLYLDDPEEGMCKAFRIGERWHFGKGEQCPHGFCHKAWKVLVIAVSELLSSPDTGLCCKPLLKESMIVSCPDGSRPVIFRIDINA
ncbi:TIGR04076 family protein [uncultured Duncaniella sp.]|uniref:TIGR04076 family protein n=1 Tax=uncultured Duncaniella sp. TaxID=2768039 RepID=UPI0025E54DB6|nr:TIGR04076 family protein [uncultured Duncaniella sp.]